MQKKLSIKILMKKLQKLLTGELKGLSTSSWGNDKKIQGVSFEQFVKDRTEKAIGDFVEMNIKEILAKRFAEIMTDKSFGND